MTLSGRPSACAGRSVPLFRLLLVATLPAFAADYSKDVHPILAASCFSCHSGDKRSGGLSMQDYTELLKGGKDGAVIQPGRGADSLLIQRVTSTSAPMPPAGRPLTSKEIDTIRQWIDDGARRTPTAPPAPTPWVAKLELTRPAVPADPKPLPVDRLLAAYLRKRAIPMPAPVTDRVFARRAWLDTVGLLPSPKQLAEFVASAEPDKRARLITQLLADNRNYTDHWISFWNDLLRNDEGVNYAGTRKSITPWLRNALAENVAYDQLLRKLLNPTAPTDPDGFLLGVNWRGDVNASQLPVIQAAQNTAQIFLGINLKCNSCHDSFISRWKLKDAYGLAVFFAPEEQLELVRCDNRTGQFTAAKFLYPELDLPVPPKSEADRRAAAAAMFTDPRNGRTPRTIVNRIWARLIGRGFVADVDDMDGEPWSPELLDWLAADFVEHKYDLKHLIATIMTSQAYQLPSVLRPAKEVKEYTFRGPERRRLTAEQFADALSAVTGEWPVYMPSQSTTGVYARQWQMPSTTLTRGLGRPIRDQVYTERSQDPTTLQALELVNGEALTYLLSRGSRRMLGLLPSAPANLYDSGVVSRKPTVVDIDITGARELRLLTTDSQSYSPERVLPAWVDAVLTDSAGVNTPLSSLTPTAGKPTKGTVTFAARPYIDGLKTALPDELVYDIAGRNFTRFRATIGVDDESILDEIQPRVRFFIFQEKPDPQALLKVAPETPVSSWNHPTAPAALAVGLFEYMLGRPPSVAERAQATAALASGGAKIKPEALADLLWALAMQPEFQLIR